MTPLEAVGIKRELLDITDVIDVLLELDIKYVVQTIDGDDCVVMDSGHNDDLIIMATTVDDQLVIVATDVHDRDHQTPCFPVFKQHIVDSIRYLRASGRVPTPQELGTAVILSSI